MNAVPRRDFCIALSAFVPMAATQAKSQHEPEKSGKVALTDSQVFSPDTMPANSNPDGRKRWDILHGMLATGEAIAVHKSLQPAGAAPNPPHAIQHSELILVQEGTLIFEYDGKSEKVGPGGVILVAFGTRHSARNVGDGPAKYLVIAIGGDTR
jgi:mannose-6-phosphate isomerase-like protein (cupin superfamily)